MRVDWEGEIKFKGKTLYVHADYFWDYDDYGNDIVMVTETKAWDDEEKEVPTNAAFDDYIADIIQDQLDNCA